MKGEGPEYIKGEIFIWKQKAYLKIFWSYPKVK